MTLALTLVAYVLALLQSPGLSTSDTKINLHVDPVTFLGQVASVWSPTEGLGHVQGGQYADTCGRWVRSSRSARSSGYQAG